MIDNLPEELIDLGKKLPLEVRNKFHLLDEPWT